MQFRVQGSYHRRMPQESVPLRASRVRPQCCKGTAASSSSLKALGWTALAFQLLPLISAFFPQKTYNNPYAFLNDYHKKQEEPPKTVEPETVQHTDGTDGKDNTSKTDGLGGLNEGAQPEYKIDSKTTMETVKTIKYGGPWHYAQYYKDENGRQVSVGSKAFIEIMNALKNKMGEVEGDRGHRMIPTTITVDGKTYSLMTETERTALGLEGKSGGADTRYDVKSGDTTWSLTRTYNGTTTTLGTSYTSKEAAEAAREADKKKYQS